MDGWKETREKGSSGLFHEVMKTFSPVGRFRPNLPPGSQQLVGWSKLCQITSSPCKMRFPLSRSSATVELEVVEVMLVDQTGFFEPLRRTRLWVFESFSSDDGELEMGVSLLATQTTVLGVALVYQMPM
ncbi:hypothetical protein QJS04_geneDACA021962 [Acorus gramineus]|uniref:Uncharacterized protein n=1 Tax=Acorus gramineus TaxID=55184 RepID=A0AAV9AAK7_ACOGR|nr:hypothetical protein QJS04_geneDACA021962 [Acorus gramineus]